MRDGMNNLITRLRSLSNDNWALHQDTSTGDGSTKVFFLNNHPNNGGTVSLGGTVQNGTLYSWDKYFGRVEFNSAPINASAIVIEYQSADFSDDEMQTVLDSNVTILKDEFLTWIPDTIAGGTTVYHECKTHFRDFEEASGGTAVWIVRDGTGVQQGTANYTPNYVTGVIRFTADQAGTSYYLSARSYDLYASAADLWGQRAARYSNWYQFQGDGQSFARHQAFDHAEKMEKSMRAQAGQNRQRGAVKTGIFVRTDVNRSSDG